MSYVEHTWWLLFKKKGRGFLYNAFHVVTNFAACRDLDKHFSIVQNVATATTSEL